MSLLLCSISLLLCSTPLLLCSIPLLRNSPCARCSPSSYGCSPMTACFSSCNSNCLVLQHLPRLPSPPPRPAHLPPVSFLPRIFVLAALLFVHRCPLPTQDWLNQSCGRARMFCLLSLHCSFACLLVKYINYAGRQRTAPRPLLCLLPSLLPSYHLPVALCSPPVGTFACVVFGVWEVELKKRMLEEEGAGFPASSFCQFKKR